MKKQPTGNARNDEELVGELAAARRRIAELEAALVEREQAGEALQASEAQYRSVVENVGIGLTLIGLDHRVILANAAQGDLFLKPAAELAGKYCFQEFEKRDGVCPHCPGVQAIATGRPAMVEATGVRDDGSVSFARVQAFPVFSDEGEPIGFIEMVEDIGTQKLAERARQESEERFRLLIEHAADAFFLYSADARILDVNRQACESLGYTREELLGLSVQDFDRGFSGPKALGQWEKLVPGQPETMERVHTRRDGTSFPVEVRLGVIESGGSRLFLALARDIADRKRAQEALARRAMQLQTGAEVSQAASSIVDPNELMRRVVDLIRERFDLYYVGLFLVDQTPTLHSRPGEWAYLRAATGEAGTTMLKQRHRLQVGGNSMIGQCIANAASRVALDADLETIRLANPLLPDTRSELALPLMSRGEAIGALTIQSSREAAFSEEDIAALEIMAGQIANSIENARLYQQTQSALEELQATHGRYLRQEWDRWLGTPSSRDKKENN
jgi:PAS domain S-box-containing protein